VFEPNEICGTQSPLDSAASFFGAAGARKQKRSIFRQPKRFLLTFFRKKSKKQAFGINF
jgi:hypothetical protein